MKVSYKVLKRYIPDITAVETVAQNLIMHTAEVEEIHSQKKAFDQIVFGKILSVDAHPNADSLRVCMVDIGENEATQIVCGGSNLSVGQGVAVAKIGASVLWHGQGEPVVMKKTAIRGVESSGMICASEEIGLKETFPARDEKEILDLSHFPAKPGTNLAVILGKDDAIIEIDNKAINHRPDMFSHIGVAREVAAIEGKALGYSYAYEDFSNILKVDLKNFIPEKVSRYMAVYVSGVKNSQSPSEILEVIASHEIESKGILVDISNYSLYLYGQPTHCFDADSLHGNIHIRFAKQGELFLALNEKQYTLSSEDIVIADDAGPIALWGIIGGKASAVHKDTKNIVIESAHFDQATIRKTGKRLGIRTDALNIFEKDIPLSLQSRWASLIVQELRGIFPEMKIEKYADVTEYEEKTLKIPFELPRIQKLIGKNYSEENILDILRRLEIPVIGNEIHVPFWRKDITHISDIAEEIARIDGYDAVERTIPKITLWAISQTPLYLGKRSLRNFLCARGFYDMYTYSFSHEKLLKKCGLSTDTAVELKNALSEEMSHMRPNLIPNLLQSLEDNIREYTNISLFECEKVFKKQGETIQENYEFAALVHDDSENTLYYRIVSLFEDICAHLQIPKYQLEIPKESIVYAHTGRVAQIILRWVCIGELGEIHPKVAKAFNIWGRIGFIRFNVNDLISSAFSLVSAKDISSFQENNFDLNFVVEKNILWKNIQKTIAGCDPLIQKVELFDIYESEEKLPGKRSLSFTIYIQSMTETLSDSVKNELIQKIVSEVWKKWGTLR